MATLTWRQWTDQAEDLLRRLRAAGDLTWEWAGGDGDRPGGRFLRRAPTLVGASLPPAKPEEDPLAARGPGGGGVWVEHHVLYSIAFAVPVLYFNVWSHEEGRIVMEEEEIRKLLPAVPTPRPQDPHGVVFSQGEHPVLGTTAHYLHPCGTAAMMKELLSASKMPYLVTWLGWCASQALLHLPVSLWSLHPDVEKIRESS